MHLTLPTLLALALTTITTLVTAIPQANHRPGISPSAPLAEVYVYRGNSCGDKSQLVNPHPVEVTNRCQPIQVPTPAKDYVVEIGFYTIADGGGEGSATLYTDGNCKNPGLPKLVTETTYPEPETVCLHPSDFQGEIWGSVLKT